MGCGWTGVGPQCLWRPAAGPPIGHCQSRRTGQTALQQQVKEICEPRVRCGHCRVHALLQRDGGPREHQEDAQDPQRVGSAAREHASQGRVKARPRDDHQEAAGP